MLNVVKLKQQVVVTTSYCESNDGVLKLSRRRHVTIRLPKKTRRNFACLTTVKSVASEPYQFTSTVGSSSVPPPPQQLLSQRHVHFLTFLACATAISATWLFCSAIPTLLAFKRAAESLEKLMDVTREELPDTMAAVRLSGMEISDLTMELSDLGQEITQGVRSSTRAVRLAEERLRRLTNMAPIVNVQAVAPTRKTQKPDPALARSARGIREGIVKGRGMVQMFFSVTRYSKILLNYFTSRAKS